LAAAGRDTSCGLWAVGCGKHLHGGVTGMGRSLKASWAFAFAVVASAGGPWTGAQVLPWPRPAAAQTAAPLPAARLAPLLQTAALMEVLAAEGRAHGGEIGDSTFDPITAARWAAVVSAIHNPDAMRLLFDAALNGALAMHAEALVEIEAFLASAAGRRIVGLELEARRALIEPAASDAAALAFQRLQARGDARLAALRRFVEVNDLVEANVTGGLNANFAFLRGIAEAGGGLGGGLGDGAIDEAGILADLWSQEDVIRQETEDWLLPFLALAYRPLTDAEMDDYIAFCASSAGRVLNRALLAAYDALFVAISQQMGRAAGRMMAGSDL
jgi:hypothetical protein